MDNTLFLKKFGERVRVLRKNRKLKQFELAAICDIDRAYIVLIEQGKVNLTSKTFIKLAEAFEMELNELVTIN